MTLGACPTPSAGSRVNVAHGGGGRATQQLLDRLFLPIFDDPALAAGHDGAVIECQGLRLALSTDGHVVQPLRFPGGDIGSLAVNGTVNDLAMCGARPLALALAFVLGEGLALDELADIAHSAKAAADAVGVRIVTGDTKVIGQGGEAGCLITSSGIGHVPDGREVAPARIRAGDVVLLSGAIARHGIAVLAAREALAFEPPITSDCAPLTAAVEALFAAGCPVHCLRDCTRGGLATALLELAETAGCDCQLEETAVPLDATIAGACELLGLDPLYVANEGRFVTVLPAAAADTALAVLRHFDPQAERVATFTTGSGRLTLQTRLGTERALHRLSGEQLPRIC